MTALAEKLARQIRAQGPIPISEYMTICLTDPEHGYYMTGDPFGRDGDFITAPEISQMFGELLGLCLADYWRALGAPSRFVLAELGPGRGTLMADLLRAASAVDGFCDAAEVVLVELSPALRARQAETLRKWNPRWVDSISEIPEGPLFVIANEFFDAMPIRQFRRAEAGWEEVTVGLRADGGLQFGVAPATPLGALSHRLDDTRPGDLVELSAAAVAGLREIAGRIAAHGGAALICDYGDWRALGDTFQAVQGQKKVDPLAAPGAADLTAHVDFEALAEAAQDEGARFSRLTPQGVFLERLGITPRAQALAQGLTDQALKAHIAAHRRLTHPDEMGTLFKVMSIHPSTLPPPPGLEP